MGPATLAAGLPVPDQAHSPEDHVRALLARDSLRPDGQLSTIREGNAFESGKQRRKSDACDGE